VYDVIIVGSGLSGTGAALELSEHAIRPLILDVGNTPSPKHEITGNLFEYRKAHDIHDITIGDRLQGLSNLLGGRQVPVKLTAPNAGYVTAGSESLGPVDEHGFSAIQSFALGGLANAWGAGCYRFTDDDLSAFPISAADLDPYFDRLTREIGIAGEADDLEPFFGTADGLLPPLRLGRNVSALYRRYRNLRERPHGFYLGRARVGVLSLPVHGRPATAYRNLEFFQEDRSLYTPRYTIERLARAGRIELLRGMQVRSWREAETIVVTAVDVVSGETHTFETRKLVLAAGAINTSRIVLTSFDDHECTLPLQENPALQFPLILPAAIGKALQTNAFGLVQLNLVWDSRTYNQRLQGSIMEITAPARAEFFPALPYAARSNLQLIRHLLPAMIVMQLFFPGSAQEPAALSLRPDGTLRILAEPGTIDTRSLRPLLRFLLRLGALTAQGLAVRVPNGHAIHYAGTLPMKDMPSRYQCHPDGRLHGTRHVFVADSAAFTSLPAKNMSFAMMANAMRVASTVARELTHL
jgi:choline dehydrogenase-like flavoprotein